jgi:hypothetical protein
MPLVTCPNCRYEQVVAREMTGLQVRCVKCGAAVLAVDSAPAARTRQPEPAAAGEPISAATVLKSVGLVAGLLLLVGVVMALIIWAVRTPSPKPPPTAPARPTARSAAAPQAAEPRDEAERERERERRRKATDELERKRQEEAERVEKAKEAGVKLLVMAAASVYGLFVLAVGCWVAYDAGGRGMSALGWASFYFLFQLIARLAVLPLAFVPALVLFPEAGSVVILAGETAAWTGLIVYLFARRSGRFARCHHCGRSRLEYLVVCPVCGAKA